MPVWMLCHAKPIFLRRLGAGNELPKFPRLSAFCLLNYFPTNIQHYDIYTRKLALNFINAGLCINFART
jgi:hypothetical protein